jgi:sugar lactone lactonase YvrE
MNTIALHVTLVGLLATLSGCVSPGSRDAARPLTQVASSPIQWTGVAVSKSGRVFVNSPNWHEGHTWSVAEYKPDGSLVPFPDEISNRFDPMLRSIPINHLVCVQSVHFDAKGRLWTLDAGSPGLRGVIAGGAKLFAWDIDTRDAEWMMLFDYPVVYKQSYFNDIRVDTAREFAYITDSGAGGIVVVDVKGNAAWRRLDKHPSVLAESIVPIVEGNELRFGGGDAKGQVPQIHSDGLALSPDASYLYWQALTGRTLYRIRTEVLRDRSLSESQVAAAVEKVGTTVVTDGMEMDQNGILYFTALEKDAIMYVAPPDIEAAAKATAANPASPAAVNVQTLVQDPRIAWPDSFALGAGKDLYFTTAQIHRTAWFTEGGTMPTTPYLVFKTTRPGR